MTSLALGTIALMIYGIVTTAYLGRMNLAQGMFLALWVSAFGLMVSLWTAQAGALPSP